MVVLKKICKWKYPCFAGREADQSGRDVSCRTQLSTQMPVRRYEKAKYYGPSQRWQLASYRHTAISITRSACCTWDIFQNFDRRRTEAANAHQRCCPKAQESLTCTENKFCVHEVEGAVRWAVGSVIVKCVCGGQSRQNQPIRGAGMAGRTADAFRGAVAQTSQSLYELVKFECFMYRK